MDAHSTLEMLNTFFLAVSFVLGCMVGSFLNVCVYRLPRGESVVRPRSHCPKCGHLIAWYDNIPIVSWLVLGAKCRHCRATISWQYALVEAITGALFLLVYMRFGAVLATPVYMLLAAGLVLVTFVDLSDWTIPNEVTFPGIPLGIACSVVGMFYPGSGFIVQDVFESLIGVVAGGGVLYLLDKIALVAFKKRGMGFGDVKLLAMLGAFMGWKGVIVVLILSSFVGSIVGLILLAMHKKTGPAQEASDESEEEKVPEGHYLPFGPYLVLAGLIYLFFGPDLIALYLAFLHVPETGADGLPL